MLYFDQIIDMLLPQCAFGDISMRWSQNTSKSTEMIDVKIEGYK